MRRSLVSITVLGCLTASLAIFSHVTHAETYSAADGMQNFGQTLCFKWVEASGSMGIQRIAGSTCSNPTFVMPLYWKTFPGAGVNRTVNVRGIRSSSAATFTCTLFVINQDALVKSQATASLTSVGAYTLLPLVVNNVTSSTFSFVACNISPANATLLNLEYTP
jgi:hypothetical protein